MSSRPSIVQWGPHECGPHCQQGAGVSALVWCGNTFTNNNAVWCWCFPTGSAEPGNSPFHSAALTQFKIYTAERGSGLQSFTEESPPSLFFVLHWGREVAPLCAQPKFELCKCQTLLVWPLRAKSSKMHRGDMLLRVQMTRGRPQSHYEEGANWALRSSEVFVSKLDWFVETLRRFTNNPGTIIKKRKKKKSECDTSQ